MASKMSFIARGMSPPPSPGAWPISDKVNVFPAPVCPYLKKKKIRKKISKKLAKREKKTIIWKLHHIIRDDAAVDSFDKVHHNLPEGQLVTERLGALLREDIVKGEQLGAARALRPDQQ